MIRCGFDEIANADAEIVFTVCPNVCGLSYFLC